MTLNEDHLDISGSLSAWTSYYAIYKLSSYFRRKHISLVDSLRSRRLVVVGARKTAKMKINTFLF